MKKRRRAESWPKVNGTQKPLLCQSFYCYIPFYRIPRTPFPSFSTCKLSCVPSTPIAFVLRHLALPTFHQLGSLSANNLPFFPLACVAAIRLGVRKENSQNTDRNRNDKEITWMKLVKLKVEGMQRESQQRYRSRCDRTEQMTNKQVVQKQKTSNVANLPSLLNRRQKSGDRSILDRIHLKK